MFLIKNKKIHLTRGDMACLKINAQINNGENHTFVAGDVVRFKVMEVEHCENVIISKDVTVSENTELVEISLGTNDTKIGDYINEPVEYWYEVELNPDTNPQTIVGYDLQGPKILILYPEGADK